MPQIRESPAEPVLLGDLDRGDVPGLVLPEEVVTSLAGQLAERARSGEPVTLTGPGGLLTGVIGQVLQAGLAAGLGAHLDGPGGDGGENRRNGSSAKTLNTEVGPVRLAVPRDGGGSFDPVLVPKQATRSDGLNAVISSLYAKGMSVRDIARHVRQTAGVDLRPRCPAPAWRPRRRSRPRCSPPCSAPPPRPAPSRPARLYRPPGRTGWVRRSRRRGRRPPCRPAWCT